MPERKRERRRLTDRYIRSLIPHATRPYPCYDADQRGLVLLVHPSGRKSFTVYYRHGGRARWHHVGDASIGVENARRLAAGVLLLAAQGRDAAAERKAERRAGSFAELHQLYVETCARRRNRSWRLTAALMQRHVLPRLGRMKTAAITRGDVKMILAQFADQASLHNQIIAAISAVFSWAIGEEVGGVVANPCSRIRRLEARSRDRILSDGEIARLWPHLDTTLRLILLTGARIAEVSSMRAMDVADGVWTLPGQPTEDWPGVKNGATHRVPLSELAAAIVAEHLARRPKRRASEALLKRLSARLDAPVRSHDLRRTFGTLVCRFKFGRAAMDRLLNHADRSAGSIYDRYEYHDEDQRAVDAIARHIMRCVEGAEADNVVRLR